MLIYLCTENDYNQLAECCYSSSHGWQVRLSCLNTLTCSIMLSFTKRQICHAVSFTYPTRDAMQQYLEPIIPLNASYAGCTTWTAAWQLPNSLKQDLHQFYEEPQSLFCTIRARLCSFFCIFYFSASIWAIRVIQMWSSTGDECNSNFSSTVGQQTRK
jgi:hypothetical protein